MANEILKDEILSEEELDNVAGGTIVETASDGQFLRDCGVVPNLGNNFGNYYVKNNFEAASQKVVDGWAQAGITCTTNADGSNSYSMDGKSITRLQAFQTVAEQTSFKLRLRAYGFPSNNPEKC